MNRKPYSTYHGRKTLLQRILTAVAVILAVALLLALVALFVLPNYIDMTYTGDTLQFNLPLPGLGQGQGGQKATPQPSAAASGDPEFVIDDHPSAAPSAGTGVEVDLSRFERRDVPLGLVVAAGEGPREQDGYIFDAPLPGHEPAGASAEFSRSFLYAATYVNPAWDGILEEDETARTTGFADYLTNWCLTAAANGYDEIILSDTVTADNDPKGEAQAALYRRVKSELDEAGWQGRLSLVLDQSWAGSQYDADLMPAVAQSFDRLYFRQAMQSNVKTALITNGFENKPANYVTVYDAIPNVNWSWAVLP